MHVCTCCIFVLVCAHYMCMCAYLCVVWCAHRCCVLYVYMWCVYVLYVHACVCISVCACVCVFPWCSASIISDRAEPHKHTCMVTKTGTPAFSLLWASPIFKLSLAPAHTRGWRAELRGHVLGSASGAAFLSSQRCHGAWASLHPSTSPRPVS